MKRIVALAAVALLLPSCNAEVEDVVTETTENLTQLRSGLVEMRLTTMSLREAGSTDTSFELFGSFELPDQGRLPVAELRYSDLGSPQPAVRGFISTGDSVFVEIDGQAYELPPDQTRSLLGDGADDSVLGEAAIDEWLIEPELAEGESLDGDGVHRVSGGLDVVAALNDLSAIAGGFGASVLEPIEDEEAERLRDAVESSRMEIVSGAEDGLLRRMLLEVELSDEGIDLADVLGPLAGPGFTLDLSISEHNRPISVEEPADALPIEELVAP